MRYDIYFDGKKEDITDFPEEYYEDLCIDFDINDDDLNDIFHGKILDYIDSYDEFKLNNLIKYEIQSHMDTSGFKYISDNETLPRFSSSENSPIVKSYTFTVKANTNQISNEESFVLPIFSLNEKHDTPKEKTTKGENDMCVIKNDMQNDVVDKIIDSYDKDYIPSTFYDEEVKREVKADAYYQSQRKQDEEYGSFIWNNEPNFQSKATPGGCLLAILFEAGIGLLLYLIFSNI